MCFRSEMLIGPRIGSLMRMNSSGEWVVTIIGQHTIQVAGPHPGENGSWYTGRSNASFAASFSAASDILCSLLVRPATAIKDIPLQNYMYKFHVGSEFVTPSVSRRAFQSRLEVSQSLILLYWLIRFITSRKVSGWVRLSSFTNQKIKIPVCN